MDNNFTSDALTVFQKAIQNYHKLDNLEKPINNPYQFESIKYFLYSKNWIDTVQWHLEDIIRDPSINPLKALQIKRKIDISNQERTNLVERIDSYFFEKYKQVTVLPNATLNTESPAWAFDRLSVLELRIYHMQEETQRKEAKENHHHAAFKKLTILIEQRIDLTIAIHQLLNEISQGKKQMKVYKQMKMYNDPSFNPILYGKYQRLITKR